MGRSEMITGYGVAKYVDMKGLSSCVLVDWCRSRHVEDCIRSAKRVEKISDHSFTYLRQFNYTHRIMYLNPKSTNSSPERAADILNLCHRRSHQHKKEAMKYLLVFSR
ncbi:hypothetical protein Cni_G10927 [Canna indica]|uniref:Uncharacterized protein n=1 Tax=Canna indica TaxID=4628 RepID=A0AAQ3K530_9LILI|nr:hypothetical protein Cni_G10927 [Canna indica]